MNLNEYYQERTAQFESVAEALKSKYNQFSIVRLIVFVGGVGLVVLLATMIPIWATALLIAFAIAGFSKFMNWHLGIQREEQHNRALSKVNRLEKRCINDDFSAFPNGEQFADALHPYTVDLDVFGDHSFYQYISRASTAIGAVRLADYLKNLVPIEEIMQRQKAISELSQKTEWRHHFQAFGMTTKDDLAHIKKLESWMNETPFVSNNTLYKIAPFLAPIIFALGIYVSVQAGSWYYFIPFLFPVGWVLKKSLDQVNDTHKMTTNAEAILAYYAKMIKHIEQAEFDSPKLKKLQSLFSQDNRKASTSIKRLSYIISQLNLRYNSFIVLLNVVVLWDLIWVRKLETWKAENKNNLTAWFEGLQEFEALNSFGNLLFNNPDWVFPDVRENTSFVGKNLGHPLISRASRVSNDLQMPTQGHIKLVTGSNMAGKSTFLRTVGLNIVLAMAGAPVCASKLTLPMMQVYTSMRTQDALHESTSSFYAELKRLKFIIEAVDERQEAAMDVFFLLDEILKGTNSRDRHTGSRALIEQLIKSKGAGIIATHDLELAALEAASDGTVENLCIEVEVKGDELVFDYKIKPGVSKSFNATQLMRSMGIRI